MPTALGTIASGYKASTGPIPTTGLQGWWDADDASTFSYSSGVVVSQWRDKSGNNRHANAPGGAAPTVAPGSMNARPTLYLTGFPCRLEIASFAGAFTTAELFAVLKVKTLDAGSRSQMFSLWGTNTEVGWYPFAAGPSLYENWGIAERPLVGGVNSATLLAPHVYNCRVAPGSLTAVINGVTIGTSAATVAFRSGGLYLLGNDFGNASPDGYMAEVVMYDRVLSTVERQQVEAYLTAKWIPAGTIFLMEPFNNFTFGPWSNSGGTIVAGRTGNGAQMGSFAQAIYTIPSGSRDGTITVGCAVKLTAAAGDQLLFGFWWPGGGTFHGRVYANLDTGILRCDGAAGTNIGSSAGGLVAAATWYYVEAQFFMHDTLGTAKVRLNGAEIINLTGKDTRAGAPTTFESVQIGPPKSSGGGSIQYDDLYITMGAGAPFKGDITIP